MKDTGTPAVETPGVADSSWRNEISARLDRYRARRKIRPPRYPSLRLPFDADEPSGHAGASAAPPVAFEPVSEHALALDALAFGGMTAPIPAADAGSEPDVEPLPEHSAEAAPQMPGAPHTGAKILEFPRLTWAPPLPPPDQLAEPVIGRPRILEVPEVAPPPPALGGITMEASERKESGKQPGVDAPLSRVSRPRRILAGAIDGAIVAAASAMFGVIFWRVAAVRPPLVQMLSLQMLSLAAGIPCLFWGAYQYLLIVYAASTPGLLAARLELVRFDGTSTRRALRRWRVLASYLSAASLGMGFAWGLLDEDALCWHDRITRTYLARRVSQPKPEGLPKT
jgi:RDD family protein